MIIEERKITVGEVCEGYFNDAEEGVVGYNERLDIRPKYQREFVYKEKHIKDVLSLHCGIISWCDINNTFIVLSKVYCYFRQKEPRLFNEERIVFSKSGAGKTGYP